MARGKDNQCRLIAVLRLLAIVAALNTAWYYHNENKELRAILNGVHQMLAGCDIALKHCYDDLRGRESWPEEK